MSGGALITDAGSTKGEICRSLAAGLAGRGVFVGSHPMAGSEKSGPEFADQNLFEGRVTVVTPTETFPEPHVAEVERFWQSLGARVCGCRRTNTTGRWRRSAICRTWWRRRWRPPPPQDLVLAATGWRDTTRVASGDVELWRQILTENRGHVLQSLDKFEKVLSAFRQALARTIRRNSCGSWSRKAKP